MPTSVATLLVTDLAESTATRVRLGEDAFDRLRVEHDRLLGEVIARWRGQVVKHTGDGVFSAFPSAGDAVSAASAIQQAVEWRNRHAEVPLRVRIGLSAGDVVVEDGDYFGTPPVEATRLCNAAEPGHILAADVVRVLAGSRGDHRFTPLGDLELKGLPPLAAVEVGWDPVVVDPPAPRRDSIDPRAVPLVGRADDLVELEREFERSVAGELRILLLSGEPGIGKTRVASEILDRHRHQAIGLSARAYPLGATASLALWTEALERHLRTLEPEAVATLCGSSAPDLAALLPSVARLHPDRVPEQPSPARVLAALAALLAVVAATAPVIVFLDDVHLADPASWDALGYLARNIPTSPVFVVLTARPVELAEHRTATEVIHGLEQDGYLWRHSMTPLTRPELVELAKSYVDPARVGDPLVDWLVERSRGVSLFAVGLLRALVEEEADLEHPELRSLPEDLTERVHARVEMLPPDSRSLLELLAVVGARVELQDVVTLYGQPLERAAETLDTLVRLRLIDEEERGRDLTYEIAHPLIQEAIYAGIGRARRRALHRHLARVLVGAGRFGAAAGHFVRAADAGDPEAVDALVEALRQADACERHHETLALLEAVLALLPSGDRRWLDVFDALQWQADWVVDHRVDQGSNVAIQTMRNIDQFTEAGGDPIRRGVVKFHLGTFLAWGAGEVRAGTALVEASRDLFDEAPQLARARLARNELGYLAAIRGDPDAHEGAARAVLADAEQAGDAMAELQALCSLVFAAQWTGRIEASVPLMDRALALARRDGKWYRTSYLLGQQAFAAALLGRPAEAAELFAAGKAVTPANRDTLLPDHEVIAAWLGGHLDDAISGGRDLLAWQRGAFSPRRMGGTFAAISAAEAGRPDESRALYDVVESAYSDEPFWFHADVTVWADAVRRGLAGDGAACRAVLLETMARATRSRGGLWGRFALLDLVELAIDTGDRDAVEIATTALAAFGPTDAPALAAIDAVVGAAGAYLRDDAEAATAALQGARGAFLDAGWRLFGARTEALLGRVSARTDPEAAVAALVHAADELGSIGAHARAAAPLAVLESLGAKGRKARAAVAGPAALTPREQEVAALAIEGLSAREIAERLFIGERTVETHMSHVYGKLGVRSRVDLVRRASELGL